MKLKALDSKILAVLDQDARLAESEIGKKIRASKQVVGYHLKKLQKNGVIENYYTMLDVGKLGFDSYYVFVQLTGLNSEEEKSLYQTILKLHHIAWLVTGVGRWDAVILFCARTVAEFNIQLAGLKRILGNHLHECIFTTLIQAEHISYKFLRQSTDGSLKTTSKGVGQMLDDIDKKILRVLAQSARMPVTEVASNLSHPVHTIHYRLQKLRKEKLIQGFRPKINVQRLGMQWHLLLIKFNSISEERARQFIAYCRLHKQVYYVTNTVGEYSIMLDVHVGSTEEFRKFLFDMKDAFGDVVMLYESVLVFEELLITYVPEIVLE
ncbi:MAG: winged helix-turn-helix transcriptional regulator [Candidatus Woesearchaeota archaeon]